MSISIQAYEGMVQRLADRDERIKHLEDALRDLVALEIGRARHGTSAFMRSGPSLALCLNEARKLLGIADEPLKNSNSA